MNIIKLKFLFRFIILNLLVTILWTAFLARYTWKLYTCSIKIFSLSRLPKLGTELV